MTDQVGRQLGNYQLVHMLGEGGFAAVYLAEHRYLKTRAAIKVLHTRLTQEDQNRFLSEAQTIAQLRHPYIVQVYDFGIEGSTPYLVMEYAPGGTLRQRHPRGTRLPTGTILAYVKQIANALQYAHDQRLIHRDIKPENLLLGRSNEVLLSDFGIATIAQTTSDLKTQGFAGTASYAAPEQLRGKPVQASDQYALAVIVYEWLSGTPPFSGSPLEVATQQVLSPPPPLHEKLPEITSDLKRVVMTALAKEPRERFGSVRAFATALEQAMQAAPAGYSHEGPLAAPGVAQSGQPGEASLSAASTQQPPQMPAAPSGEASIYSAPTQHVLAPPSAQPDALPTQLAQDTPPPDHTPLAPVAPVGWANVAPATTPPPDDTFATPLPVPGEPDARRPATPGISSMPPLPALPPTRKPRRARGRVLLLLFLMVLLIGGGLLAAAVIMQTQATEEAQASGTATAQAQANAQATATANAEATANAQVQATAGVIQTATTGQPRYDDPLTAGNVTNPTWMKDGTACFFAADGYHVHVEPPAQGNAGQLCLETGRTFRNATITIEMRLRGGYSGGLVLRLQNNQGYFFEVGAGGNYHIGVWGAPILLQDWTDAGAIHQGLFSSNTIQVIAQGSVFWFYINGVYLTEVRDTTLTVGAIGFFSQTDPSGPGEAVFSNLKVYVAS